MSRPSRNARTAPASRSATGVTETSSPRPVRCACSPAAAATGAAARAASSRAAAPASPRRVRQLARVHMGCARLITHVLDARDAQVMPTSESPRIRGGLRVHPARPAARRLDERTEQHRPEDGRRSRGARTAPGARPVGPDGGQRTDRRGQLSGPGARLHREHDRQRGRARVRRAPGRPASRWRTR